MRWLILLFMISGCNEDFSGGVRWVDQHQQQEQFAPTPDFFRTRLNNSLLVSGEICLGDETIMVENIAYPCEARQYLIKIDNVNSCDSDGNCSGFSVRPFIADLVKVSTETPGNSIFDINPASPTTNEQENILETIGVSSDLNGNGSVFFKIRTFY